MTEFMKTVLRLCTNITICALISQLQKALKSLQAIKNKIDREKSKKRKIREWRKKRLEFLLIFISSTFERKKRLNSLTLFT